MKKGLRLLKNADSGNGVNIVRNIDLMKKGLIREVKGERRKVKVNEMKIFEKFISL
jgi:hypothetical protein